MGRYRSVLFNQEKLQRPCEWKRRASQSKQRENLVGKTGMKCQRLPAHISSRYLYLPEVKAYEERKVELRAVERRKAAKAC